MDCRVRQIQISGILQMCIGVLCFILGFVDQFILRKVTLAGFFLFSCIWVAIMQFYAGVYGVRASKKATRSEFLQKVSGYLCLTITSIIFTFIVSITRGIFVYQPIPSRLIGRHHDVSQIFSAGLFFLGIIEFGVGIWAAVSCCVVRVSCTREEMMPPGPHEQGTNLQSEGTPQVLHFLVKMPDGTFTTLPAAQISGPITEPDGIPVYSPVYETAPQLLLPPPYEPAATPQIIAEDDQGETTAF